MKNRILVVEEDDAIRAALGKVLAAEDFDVLTAADAEEAMPLFDGCNVDLLLLDLSLPTKNGWDLFEHFSDINPLVPIIILTGQPEGEDSCDGSAGDAMLEKPVDVTLLIESIAALLAEPADARLHRLIGRNVLSGLGGAPRHGNARSPGLRRRRCQATPG
jgi:DNA-binding response OmpR family regulator